MSNVNNLCKILYISAPKILHLLNRNIVSLKIYFIKFKILFSLK